MLKLNNTKYKIGAGIASAAILSLSAWSYINLAYIPQYTYATEDPRTMDDIAYMQDITPTICNNTPEADTAGNNQFTFTDKRDGKTYTVAKLKDGNCWMTQNLSIINKTLSSEDSDMDSGSFTIPASSAASTAISNIAGFEGSDTLNPNAFVNSYGGYYNWYTATAGTNGPSASICPKGWQLPVNGNTDKSYSKLLIGLTKGTQIANVAPYYFTYGGYVVNGSLTTVGTRGNYWSSTIGSTDYSYYLSFTETTVTPSNSYARSVGFSVRCVNSDTRYNDNPYVPPLGENQSHANIAVGIPSLLTIDATSDMDEVVDANGSANGTISATISGNTTYDVTLSAEQVSLQKGSDTLNKINPVPTTNTLLSSNTWGIYTGTNDNSITDTNINNKLYSPITTIPTTYYNTTTANPNSSTTHTYDIGIQTSPSLPAGTYSTSVTVTVSPK